MGSVSLTGLESVGSGKNRTKKEEKRRRQFASDAKCNRMALSSLLQTPRYWIGKGEAVAFVRGRMAYMAYQCNTGDGLFLKRCSKTVLS